MREPLRQQGSRRPVADPATGQLVEEFADDVPGDAPAPGTARHDHRARLQHLRGVPHRRPDGAADDLGHPPVALEGPHLGRFGAADADLPAALGRRRQEFVDRPLVHLDLAEGRQDRRDVLQERAVRTDDEDALPRQAFPVRVQQPRGAVQADGRLPRAGGSLDADRRLGVGADEGVLLGLDGGDDVAHRARARTLDLAGQDVRGGVHLGLVGEVLVLVGRQAALLDAEPAAQPHAGAVVAGRAVEPAGDVGAPVDDDRVAGGVGDVPAADVQALAVVVVGAAEEQRGGRVVDEAGGAAVQRPAEGLVGAGVAGVTGGEGVDEGQGVGPHAGEFGAGVVEVPLLGGQHLVRGVLGHGSSIGSTVDSAGTGARQQRCDHEGARGTMSVVARGEPGSSEIPTVTRAWRPCHPSRVDRTGTVPRPRAS